MQSLESLQIAKHPQNLKISQNPTDVFFRLLNPRSENLETSLFRGLFRGIHIEIIPSIHPLSSPDQHRSPVSTSITRSRKSGSLVSCGLGDEK